jgi:predicted anti-sigma-YlaC factor YlaD
MRCEVARERLREHLDGQLSPTEAGAVQAHLDACAACRAEWALLRQVDAALATLPVLDEPVDFTARVMARVREAAVSRAPVSLPALRGSTGFAQVLRWEDAVVSFAFAWAMMTALFALTLLGNQEVSSARVLLQQAWWDLLPKLDRLWYTVQTEPVYLFWALSCLCAAAAVGASAIAVVRWWSGRIKTSPAATRSVIQRQHCGN